jgi:hypothetical protein
MVSSCLVFVILARSNRKSGGYMKDFTRPDAGTALAVDEAIEMEASSGRLLAWQYMHTHAVPPSVAARVLSQNGPRRALISDGQERSLNRRTGKQVAQHVLTSATAELGTILKLPVPRTDQKLSETIDLAIEMMGTRSRFYAEALLRIHAVRTPVIMRVLFNTQRRRTLPSPITRLAPVIGIQILKSG